jgi:hypothetical protein
MKRGLVWGNIYCGMYSIGFQKQIAGGKRESLDGVVGKLTIISRVRMSVREENYLS